MVNKRKTSPAGIELIKGHESCRLTAYLCPAGKLTIGYGHTGTDVHPGLTITQAQADQLLANDLALFERTINQAISVPLNQNQFDALVSFCFNIGAGGFRGSTLRVLLNEGNYRGAADQLLRWDKAAGKTLPGLTRRRAAERQLFLKPVLE